MLGCAHAAAHVAPVATVATPAKPIDLEIVTSDAREWKELADSFLTEAHVVSYGNAVNELAVRPSLARVTSTDVSFGLPRYVFFDERDGCPLAVMRPWLERIASSFAKLSKGAKMIVTSSLEDEAVELPTSAKIALSNQRVTVLHDALVTAGVDPARLVVDAVTALSEGDYNGPPDLDPAYGRITFAVTR